MLTSGQTGQKTGSKQTLLFMTRGRQVGREKGRQTGHTHGLINHKDTKPLKSFTGV
jgi:hypothetical protein